MRRIDSWKGIHSGPVLVIGNGPSATKYDISSIPFPSISMNRGYELFEGDYYITLMDTFYMEKVAQSKYDHVFMCGGYTEIPANIRDGFKPDLTCIPRLSKRDPSPPEPLNLSKGWKVSHTGVLALYLAAWMGFDTAILVGYDGHGRHFMPRVLADDIPNHKRHIAEMYEFMSLDSGLTIYNCCYTNSYGHNYISFDAALERGI